MSPKKLFIIFSFIIASLPARSQISKFWGNLQPGKYGIGFRAFFLWDSTRTFHHSKDFAGRSLHLKTERPIRVYAWYPSAAPGGVKMNYEDYLSVKTSDKDWRPIQQALNDYDIWATLNWTNQADSSRNKILKAHMEAVANAKAHTGKFPLIVHFTGLNSRRIENIPMWEFLASHGYVVIVIPELGFDDVVWELSTGEFDREMNVRDMEFAIKSIKKRFPQAQAGNIGAIGYSFGGVYGLRLAFTNPAVKAVATLDGTVNSKLGQGVLNPEYFDPQLKAAWLNIYGADNKDPDFTIFDTLKYADRYRFRLPHASHGEFEDFAMATSLLPDQTPAFQLGFRTPAMGKEYYETNCKYLLQFFNAYLKNDNEGIAYIKRSPDVNGYSKEIVDNYVFKEAKHILTNNDLARSIIYNGKDKTWAEYNAFNKKYPDANTSSEKGLINYSRYIKFSGRRLDNSIEILQFVLLLNPASAEAYYQLGVTYHEQKKEQQAKLYLKKCIDVDPKHENAKKLMEEIKY